MLANSSLSQLPKWFALFLNAIYIDSFSRYFVFLQHAEVDSEGKVSLSQLTALLESSIYEKSDSK